MEKNLKSQKWKVILICLVTSFLFLMICSNNSFLYSFNDNQDVNWYITMGRGLNDGKIPYKDLYEQKGPIVYFVFCLITLFSNEYLMTFFLEVICSTIFLYFSYKIITNIKGEKNWIYSIILTAFLTFTSCYFVVGGGAVEEYCLPIFSYMLYCFIDFIENKSSFSILRCLIWGVLIGVLMFIKYTLLVFPFMIFIYFCYYLLKSKKIKDLLLMSLLFLVGFIVVTIPIILYFYLNDALIDFLTAYYYNNLFLYQVDSSIGYCLSLVAGLGFLPFAFMLLGAIKYNKTYLILFGVYTFILIVTGNFSYYFLPLVIFIPVGVSMFFELFIQKFPNIINKKTTSLSLIVLLIFTFVFANGTLELNKKKSDYIHFQIAKDIRSINNDDPTLFCYKLWDYGFYNVLNVVPNVKYYANNVFDEDDFKEMYDSFKGYIESKQTEFLLVEKKVYEEEKQFIEQYYEYYKSYSYKYYKDNYRSFELSVVLLISK